MVSLGARERKKLPDSSFAYVDSAGRRRLPIHDEAHVRNAIARFSRTEFEDEAARDRARTRLLRAAKRHGIVPVGFIDGQLRPERRLPTGRVALLYADVEASTKLLTDLGDRYSPMLSQLRRILRRATRKAGGHEVDARADEYFAAFVELPAALDAAIGMQRLIGANAWTDGLPVKVRIGLHVGRPTLTATGYVGIAVNTVARICDSGHGGQIVVSSAVRDGLEPAVGVTLKSLGHHRLRGIPDEHELFGVTVADLPSAFPPPRIQMLR